MGEASSVGRMLVTGVAVAALGGTGYWMLREQSSRKAAKRAIQSCGSNICVAFETQYHKMTAQYFKLAEANKLLKREIQSLMGAAREVESQAVVAVVDEKSDPKKLFLVLRAELHKTKQNLEDLEGQNKCLQAEVDELRAAAELTEKGIAEERSNIKKTLELMREENSRKDAESGALRQQNLKLATDVGRLQASLIHATKVLDLHEKTPSSRNESLLLVADAQSKHHDDGASQMSEATNMSDVSNVDRMNGNKGKFDKIKQQRNLFREQLKHSTLEMANLRKEVASLRDLQSKHYVA
mmetsp:Transcript_35797/g.60315  ORF Transcript_35797/g.60315 Transcript_35797/m.60315 type:complete len:297 (-) Transcript_35797:196-1086(-)